MPGQHVGTTASIRNRLVAGCGLLAIALSAGAQPPALDDPPRVALITNGPADRPRALAFSEDSRRLFSAGFDKVVHTWTIGVDPNFPSRDLALYDKAFRWQIGRSNRGVITDMALGPQPADRTQLGAEIALTGFVAQDTYQVVLDADSGKVRMSLPARYDTQQPPERHIETTIHTSYSPDGALLATVDRRGRLLVWELGANQQRVAQERRPALVDRNALLSFCPATFVSNRLIFAADFDVNRQEASFGVLLDALTGERVGRIPFGGIEQRALSIARDPDAKQLRWASIHADGSAKIWRVDANRQLAVEPLPINAADFRGAIGRVAFGAGGLIAVGPFRRSGRDEVEVWSANTRQKLHALAISAARTTWETFALTVSPDGQRLAAVDVDTSSIVLFRLANAAGVTLATADVAQSRTTLIGDGREILDVAWTEDGGQLGIGMHRLSLDGPAGESRIFPQHFLVDRPAVTPTPPAAKLTTGLSRSAWKFATPLNSLILELPNRPPLTIAPWDFVGLQGNPTAVALLTDAPGNAPYAVAIGTQAPGNGIYVYELLDGNLPPRLIRHFRDHNSTVTSLAPSPDGRFLLSGSKDQTIKIWSLEGLRENAGQFPQSKGWGAQLRLNNGQLVATNVVPAGILYSRGIRDGDTIARIRFQLPGQPPTDVREPAAILETLSTKSLLEQVRFNWSRGNRTLGGNDGVAITPGWEPLLTLFTAEVGQTTEWTLFTPQGYFDASQKSLGKLFGWQINRGADQTPEFYLSGDLAREFQQPDIIRRILPAGNLRDAMTQANYPVRPDDLPEYLKGLARRTIPTVEILQPKPGQLVGPEGVAVVAKVTYPPQSNPDNFALAAHQVGRAIDRPKITAERQEPDQSITRELTFPKTAPAEAMNRIEVRVEAKGTVGNFGKTASQDVIATPKKSTAYRLHTFRIACNAYEHDICTREGLKSLRYPEDDARAIDTALAPDAQSKVSRQFAPGERWELLGTAATREAIISTVEQIRSKLSTANPDDVLLIFLAGHGKGDEIAIREGGEDRKQYRFNYVPFIPKDKQNPLFVDFADLLPLAELKCLKLLLIDACESGSAVYQAQALRGFSNQGLLMVTAAADKQPAQESAELGHGIFSYEVIQALSGEPDAAEKTADGVLSAVRPEAQQEPADGVLTIGELATHLRTAVPRRLDKIATESNITQDPVVSPNAILDRLRPKPLMRLKPIAAVD